MGIPPFASPFLRGPRSVVLTVLAISGVLIGTLVGCGSDSVPQAGVISTGNAGRVVGWVRSDRDTTGGIEGARVVLEVLDASAWTSVDTLGTDSIGAFAFDSLKAGTYRVVARDAVGNSGTSASFTLADGAAVRIVVVLVPVTKVKLAFLVPTGTSITSVVVEGTGAFGVKSGDAWILDLKNNVREFLDVRLIQGSTSDTIRYELTWAGGEPILTAVDEPDAPVVRPQVLDSVALLADWDFEGSVALVDHSGRGNTGTAHGGVTAVPGLSAWRFDGIDGYVSLGDCIVRKTGTCADWSDGNVTIQTVLRLESQAVDPVAHVWTFRSGNGEIMLKRFPGDSLSVGTASPAGFAGFNMAWKARLGKWVDLAIVRDSATDSMIVYLDGLRAGAFLAAGPMHSSAGIPPALGAYTSGGIRLFAEVELDRVRVWAGKFDAAQVLALHRGL